MIDIKLILEHPERIKDSIQKRGLNVNLDPLLGLYSERKTILTNIESKRAESNQIAKNISKLKDKEQAELIQKGRSLNHEIANLEESFKQIEESYHEAMLSIPNLLPEDTPLGHTDADNVVIKTHLSPRIFDFAAKDHLELGKSLDLIDFESAAKVAGSKFYFLKNEAVLLELGLKLFALNLAKSLGYTPLITPDVAKSSILAGAGFAPRGEESNIYNLEDLDLSLIATAEIPVAGMHANERIENTRLPLKYVAESHCFRREAGGGGTENKGLYRVHQFSKIELFQITQPQDSEAALEEILRLQETIYQKLQLPYRVVRICAGDLGAAAFKKYDIEVWMPGRESEEKYGEVTSASNCTDFQARRLNIKYREDKKNHYAYTLNGTAIAMTRTLMAILENYQQADGSVLVPEVLQPYVGMKIITR